MTQDQAETIVTGTGFNLTERLRRVLDFVKAHPNCTTSELYLGVDMTLKDGLRVLKELLQHKYVGRQVPTLPGEYESRWLAERRKDA